MSGQFYPVAGNSDIVWRTFVDTDKGQYYAAVVGVAGSTTGDAHLCVWAPDTSLIHRGGTKVGASALFGVDRRGESEWDSEITRVLQHAEYRRIEGSE